MSESDTKDAEMKSSDDEQEEEEEENLKPYSH